MGVQGRHLPVYSHRQGISLSLFSFLFLKCRYLNIYTPACPTLMPLTW